MIRDFFVALLKAPIFLYRTLISPWIPRRCRYYPSCSSYAQQALDKHGPMKGIYLTIARFLRCHPFSRHCFDDPVPEQFTWGDALRYKRRHKQQ